MRQYLWLTFRRVGVAAAAVMLLFAMSAAAPARDATDGPGKGPGSRPRARSPFNLSSSSTYLMNFNNWLCGLQEIGEVWTSSVGSSVGGGGFWPQGTANQYIFNSGLQVAAVVGADGGAAANDTLATFFFNASATGAGARSPFTPGIYSSARADDLAAWPQDCYLDNPVFGRVKTLSELDTCVQYWDGDPTASHFPDSHPMGLLVTQHSLLWSFPSNKDIMFFIYKFKNVTNTPEFKAKNPAAPAGGWTLTNVYSAFAMDPDVSGGEYGENFASVVPELNMGTAWQYDFEAADFVPYPPNFDAAVGFVGVKFLKSPVNTADTAITVRIGSEVRTVAKGEELGMTFFSIFTNGGIMSDAGNGHQAFRYLSGNLLPTETAQWCPSAPPGMCYVNLAGPDDMRFYQSSGPFTLKPGQEAQIVVAYVAGAPVPGTYTKGVVLPVGEVTDTTRAIEKVMGRGYNVPGFPSLFANAKTAQAIFDADFILPSSPQAPNVTVIPGDKQNTILWDASSLDKQDAYCQLATDPTNALYDPNFVCKDVEGFRVYRKSNPSAAWTPIAQFDLANGVVEQVTVLEQVETADGSIIVVKADTARVCPSGTKEQLGLAADFAGCVGDSGLKFAVVDRGGSMPDPSNGPGLINGIRYYYAVTAFDINSPFSGPSSLESAKVLDQATSGVPRPLSPTVTASTATVRLIGSGGAVLDTTGTSTLDPATGAFNKILPTNGFRVTADLVPELLSAEAKVTVKVDSIVPGAPQVGLGHTYYLTATGPGGTSKLVMPVTNGYTGTSVSSASSGFDATKTKVVGGAAVYVPGGYLLAGMQRGVVNGAHFSGKPSAAPSSWPRWFVSGSGETPDGTAGNQYAWCGGYFPLEDPNSGGSYCPAKGKPFAGALAGYGIAPMIAYSSQTSISRGFDGILGGVWRAADIEITWGDNGAVTSVQDLTHKVPVPFNAGVRASYGFMTNASFTGVDATKTRDKNNSVITFSDFTCLNPVNEYSINGYFDNAGSSCKSPVPAQLQPKAELVKVNWVGEDWTTANWQGTTSQVDGISMYINGQVYHFIGSALPAAGTKWTLRTFAGYVSADQVVADGEVVDYTNYKFFDTVRPPAVPGLTAEITVSAAVIADATQVDLDKVHTVPDPYYVTSKLENSSAEKRMLFVNLPTKATIRVYSLSGVLLAVLNHDDAGGSGTQEWDLRTRNNQFIASGVYFYHIEAPNGKTKVGKFTIVQYAQ